ncbi:SPASM domain-containing protein [Blastopirellula marina]|nr:SPASM domain-containing protein [Blastopirellula marina]
MTRLKYDPWMLALQMVDASGSRTIDLPLACLSGILTEAGQVASIRSVQVRGVKADPGEMPDLVQRGRMIAVVGFPQRTLLTTGQGMLRQEAEEVLRAFTSIEFALPNMLQQAFSSVQESESSRLQQQLADWLRTIEYYARVKQAWQLTADLVVRIPGEKLAIDLCQRLDALNWRSAFRVQRACGAAAFSLEQQQAEYGMKLCEEPYRVMTFSASGELTGCSGDQRRRVYFGRLEQETLRDLWEGPAMEAWRQNRTTSQCQGCSGLGTTIRRPSLIGIYDSIGEQHFHEFPQQQLRRIAEESETKAASSMRPKREIFRTPRQAF